MRDFLIESEIAYITLPSTCKRLFFSVSFAPYIERNIFLLALKTLHIVLSYMVYISKTVVFFAVLRILWP